MPQVQGHRLGLSPRGRGNPGVEDLSNCRWRSIPAWAGKPYAMPAATDGTTVYPRVGGETLWSREWTEGSQGLSPRGRGNRRGVQVKSKTAGSIPAWAGKPIGSAARKPVAEVYPRVGGETGRPPSPPRQCPGLSPRGRGNHKHPEVDHVTDRSIPAWAGKPTAVAHTPPPKTVYPRVGGETVANLIIIVASYGLSPRGRGNPKPGLPESPPHRSIPAWAGKP